MTDFSLSRRGLVLGTATSLAAGGMRAEAATAAVKAIAFDGFPIFDPRSIAAKARGLFPGKGDALAGAWSNKLFGYTWIVTAADHYQDFEALADASLRYAAESLQLDLTSAARSQLVGAYSQLDVWPDVKAALSKLKAAGIRLAFLSNLTERMLRANMRNADIRDLFELALSTDRVRRFKPAAVAYQMAVDGFHLPKSEIGFAAFGGWDAYGASAFGYRTAWINRMGLPAEQIEPRPVIVTRGIEGVLALAGVR